MQCSKDLVIRQSDPWKPGHAHSRFGRERGNGTRLARLNFLGVSPTALRADLSEPKALERHREAAPRQARPL